MKISLAITSYNRHDLVIESFSKVINNQNIDEIVILDDFSDISIFRELENSIKLLKSDKIKLYRNQENLKPFLNKYNTVKKCKNEWVILLDSDNIIDDKYIDTIMKLELDINTIYVPEKLVKTDGIIGWDYKSFSNIFFNHKNIKDKINELLFLAFLNTGNFLVNRENYIKTIESENIDECTTNDAIYFSYLWIKNLNNMCVVNGLQYIHRVHGGSWYINNSKECDHNTNVIVEKIKHLP